ncbi:MAG TPA: HRDC domain-containing protein [Marinobacter sp.]|nr:HRDC domain-containing protein [Marinobacter sp.]
MVFPGTPTRTAHKVPSAPDSIQWLHEPAALDSWLDRAPAEPLAVDTEFERVSTFYPIPGLVQLGLGGEFCLVDPSVAEHSAHFRARLTDSAAPKILYAMSEDLELFRHWLGIEPKGLIDLQIGAALAGAGFSVGYARLVESLFGEALDKSATRSDWLKRPLSDAQQRYAIDDIRFLEPMYRWVLDHLRERGLETALMEESDRFADSLAAMEDPATHYLKLRGGWALPIPQQIVLMNLVQWRELEAQRQDRPRNRVLADALLIAIAESAPKSLAELSDIQGVPGGVVRRYGETLLDYVKAGLSADSSGFEAITPPLTRDQQVFFKQLKSPFKKAAQDADIPVELLAPRKRLEKVVQDRDLAGQAFFHGWREQILTPVRADIEELLKS